MSEENNGAPKKYDFVDISSSSGKPQRKKVNFEEFSEKYGSGIFKNLGNIIKVIAFIICFFIIIVTFVGAYFLFSFDKFFVAIAIGVIIFGTAIALISLFLIYSLGHIVNQNNEILSRLRRLMK